MEQEILNRLEAQQELLQKIYVSTEKTRKYFMWTLIASVVVVLFPLVGLVFAIPAFLSSLGGMYGL